MAHGYAKVAGKPMAAIMHGTVGTQHASMAIYNAYCDRVPMLLFTGNAGPLTERRPGVEWFHSVQDGAATVRHFVQLDDSPTRIAAAASLSDLPFARLNEIVVATNWLWWLTASGVFAGP